MMLHLRERTHVRERHSGLKRLGSLTQSFSRWCGRASAAL
jgi:hypothetical protein